MNLVWHLQETMVKKYTILTADRKILSYPHVNAIW